MPFQIAYQVRVLSDYFPTRVNDYFPSMNAPRAPPAEAARHAPVDSARPTGAILIISLGIPSELWVQHLRTLLRTNDAEWGPTRSRGRCLLLLANTGGSLHRRYTEARLDRAQS